MRVPAFKCVSPSSDGCLRFRNMSLPFPLATHRQRIQAITKIRFPFARIVDHGSQISGFSWTFPGEPLQVLEVLAAHRGGRLEFNGSHAVYAFGKYVDLAVALIAPMKKPKTVSLKWRGAKQFGKHETSGTPAMMGRFLCRAGRSTRRCACAPGAALVSALPENVACAFPRTARYAKNERSPAEGRQSKIRLHVTAATILDKGRLARFRSSNEARNPRTLSRQSGASLETVLRATRFMAESGMEIEQHLYGEAENPEKYDNNSVLYAARTSVESLNPPLILADGA